MTETIVSLLHGRQVHKALLSKRDCLENLLGILGCSEGLVDIGKQKNQFLFAKLKRQSCTNLPLCEYFCNCNGYKTEAIIFILPFKKASKLF